MPFPRTGNRTSEERALCRSGNGQRDETDLRTSLTDAGFAVCEMYGDWHKGPIRFDGPGLFVVARKV